MKQHVLPALAALASLASPVAAQNYGYPPAGAGLQPPPAYTAPSYGAPAPGYGAPAPSPYPGIAPSLPPPTLGSPYAGPTMMDPMPPPPPPAYGFQQPAPTNAWGGIQQSVEGSMLNYQYLEVGYRYLDPKGGDYNGSHGLGGTLVLQLPAMFFLKASVNWTSGSGTKTARGVKDADYDLSTITIGGGLFMAVKPNFHFVGEAGFVYANFDGANRNHSFTEAGIYVRPSLRYQMVDWLELQTGVTVTSMSDFDSKIWDLGGYFRVMPQFDLNLGFDIGDQNRTLRAGGRLRW